jgi:prophage regulatory protein
MSASTKLLRLSQIIGKPGNPNAIPAIPTVPAIIPICASAWWQGVKDGRYPKSIKLSPRVTVWRENEVLALIGGAAT